MSDQTVSVTYVGPCAEVITRKGRTYVKGEEQDVPRDEAMRLSGDFEVDGQPISEVVAEARASAAAEKLAAKHDIDLTTVKGTGKNDSVTKGDVQKLVDEKEAAAKAEADRAAEAEAAAQGGST
jgi:2-oxoglutarate dehydrogenase E2 component (dihydrolipoamide succinyltransferase)